jgi:phosphoribosylformylglycinamidine synthase
VRLDAADPASAENAVKEMCEKLLANTVIETYRFEVVPR